MKHKKILFFLCLFLLFFFMIFHIWNINRFYPEPELIVYKKGETLETLDWKITLNNWEFYSQGDLEQILEKNNISNFSPMAKKKLFYTELVIINAGDETNTLDVTNFAFESLAWHNQWSMELFYALNDVSDMAFELDPGEKCKIILPIILYDFQFKRDSWEHLEQRTFYLVLSYYPVKYVFTNQ